MTDKIDPNLPKKQDSAYFLSVIGDKDIPKFYCNGFINGIGHGDVTVVFQRNQNQECVINMSYTIAKTLASKILNSIVELEKATGNAIMTTDEIDKALAKQNP